MGRVNRLVKLYEKVKDMNIVANFIIKKWLQKHGLFDSINFLKNNLDFILTAEIVISGIICLVEYSSLENFSLNYATVLNSKNEGIFPIFSLTKR